MTQEQTMINIVDTEKNICLDLDSTLIYSIFNEDDIEILSKDESLKDRIKIIEVVDIDDNSPIGKGELSKICVVLRPHVDAFITFCKCYFDKIYIWSAGHQRYVRAIVNVLFENTLSDIEGDYFVFKCNNPDKVYTRENCIIEEDNIFKPFSHYGLDFKRTIMIDDRKDTFSKNAENGILIPAYKPKHTQKSILKDEDSLLTLIKWFNTVEFRTCDDVRSLNKKNIFPKSKKK